MKPENIARKKSAEGQRAGGDADYSSELYV